MPLRQLFKLWKETESHDLYLFPSHTQIPQQLKCKKYPISMLRKQKLRVGQLFTRQHGQQQAERVNITKQGAQLDKGLEFSIHWCRETIVKNHRGWQTSS